jgi:hypothetical protein
LDAIQYAESVCTDSAFTRPFAGLGPFPLGVVHKVAITWLSLKMVNYGHVLVGWSVYGT